MKVVEYSKGDLEYLKAMYDRFGRSASRGGVNADEYRALKDAGMLDGTSAADAEPERTAEPTPEPEPAAKPMDGRTSRSKRERILDYCLQRLGNCQPVTAKETAQALGLKPKTCSNIIGRLRNEGLLPAAEPTTPPKPKPKPAFKPKEKHMPDDNPQDTLADHQELTADTAPTQADRAEQALEDAGRQQTQTENTAVPTPKADTGRACIADRLVTLHKAMLDVLSASFAAGDKVVYAYACKLLSGEIMDLKSNYSKDAK